RGQRLLVRVCCHAGPTLFPYTTLFRSDNVVDITLASHVPPPDAIVQRQLIVNSSCGLCGRQSLDEVHQNGCYPIDETSVFTLDEPTVMGLPDLLREEQKVFAKTGGLHGAGHSDIESG